MNLHMSLVEVNAGNREDLLDALRSLSDYDCDFNGENGIEYLWDEIDENKFDSSMDYLISEVKDISDDEECVRYFIATWMEHDKNYYEEYQLDFIKDGEDNVIAIAFATTSRY